MSAPFTTPERWRTLVAVCAQMDDRYNRQESVGKPRLTCGNDGEHGFDRGTMGAENDSGPGAARTARGPASPTKED